VPRRRSAARQSADLERPRSAAPASSRAIAARSRFRFQAKSRCIEPSARPRGDRSCVIATVAEDIPLTAARSDNEQSVRPVLRPPASAWQQQRLPGRPPCLPGRRRTGRDQAARRAKQKPRVRRKSVPLRTTSDTAGVPSTDSAALPECERPWPGPRRRSVLPHCHRSRRVGHRARECRVGTRPALTRGGGETAGCTRQSGRETSASIASSGVVSRPRRTASTSAAVSARDSRCCCEAATVSTPPLPPRATAPGQPQSPDRPAAPWPLSARRSHAGSETRRARKSPAWCPAAIGRRDRFDLWRRRTARHCNGDEAAFSASTGGRALRHASDRPHNRTCFRVGTRLPDQWSPAPLGADTGPVLPRELSSGASQSRTAAWRTRPPWWGRPRVCSRPWRSRLEQADRRLHGDRCLVYGSDALAQRPVARDRAARSHRLLKRRGDPAVSRSR
jgi:hypothetical protein